MRNTGTPPPFEAVDIRFRGGVTARRINPKQYRWTLNDASYPRDYAFDIVEWQPAK